MFLSIAPKRLVLTMLLGCLLLFSNGTTALFELNSQARKQIPGLGILEIYAYQNGKVLSLKKDSPADILHKVLNESGTFKVERAQRVDSASWVDKEIFHYVSGSFQMLSNTQLLLELELWDLISMEKDTLVHFRDTISAAEIRPVVLKFADQLVWRFYGKAASFSQRQFYICRGSKFSVIQSQSWDGVDVKQHATISGVADNLVMDSLNLYFTHWQETGPVIQQGSLATKGVQTISPQGYYLPRLDFNGNLWATYSSASGAVLQRRDKQKWHTPVRSVGDKNSKAGPSAWRTLDSAPAWTMDGGYMFLVRNRGFSGVLVRRSLVDGSEQEWNLGLSIQDIQVDPEQESIAFSARKGAGSLIGLLNLASGEITVLTDVSQNENPVWSRDGRMISFSSDRGGSWEVYRMRRDGSMLQKITSGGHCTSPYWSP